MDYLIVAITVIFGAGLTFFSGFGLGTLMLPVFMLFFDPAIAVGATAIVHLSNNVFKFTLVSKHIHIPTLLRFGIPAFIFAAIGGALLKQFADMAPYYTYSIGEHIFQMNTVGTVIGILMIFFAWFDLDPRFDNLKVEKKHIPYGGILSGFFGGVSGHQGAFRAAFLSKAGLTKEQFIGTSNAVSMIVDISRLAAYFYTGAELSDGEDEFMAALTDGQMLLVVAIIFAFVGTFVGKQLVKKTTITVIQRTVGVLLVVMGLLMISGLIK